MYYIFVYVLKYNLVNRIFSIIKRNFLKLVPRIYVYSVTM